MAFAPSINEILRGQIYLGNLSAALSVDRREKTGITHVVSVCPDYPSSGEQHLSIPVHDTEYEDILIHLPKTCEFIQAALDQGGKVLVHCVMGISRSTTVVAAYLMKTKNLDAGTALRFIKQRRPQVHPNYGFIKQLDVFAKCNYDPNPTNSAYRSWQRRREQDVTCFLNHMADTVSIIPDKLLLSSDFPSDSRQAVSLLLDMGVTHILSLSPAEISSAVVSPVVKHHHLNISNQAPEALLVALPDACKFISDAINADGQVLVHCLIESRACTVVSAYLMASSKSSPENVFAVLEDALPLYNPTRSFSHHLELFEACGYKPTRSHPLVKAWLASDDGSQTGSGLTLTSQSHAEDRRNAANVLSETGRDLSAFGDALAAIQLKAGLDGGALTSTPPMRNTVWAN
ncbi:hypothetical protein K443DRAFT_679103 [Laccaria amethystina LaAM-08-1]|uniref:protein-tyrosine-phosphatase n=1 Tax=Laccaria amethystina LaAM-08-1 TaxID=1095629 RepID=A0A0C9WQH9_9AGAR|nr:hypothetical protein K443DRAFT_679103 [Laccaria amethystina LaAM-08-1]